MLISRQRTIEALALELEPVLASDERQGLLIQYVPEDLELHLTMQQLSTGRAFFLLARLDEYPVRAPLWSFATSKFVASQSPSLWPKPKPGQGLRSSVLHGKRVICAPFNRLAYSDHAGLHQEWGASNTWRDAQVGGNIVRATHLAEMIDRMWREVRASHGDMS